MAKTAIIGAGIAGLSAAWYLSEKHPDDEITIFESDRKGGVIHTEVYENALLESGPGYVIADNPAFHELCSEIGISDLLLPAKDKKIFYRNQAYQQKVPSDFLSFENNFLSFLGSGFNSFFAMKKKVSLWGDTSLFDLLKATYGQSYTETLGSVYSRFAFRNEIENIDFSSNFPQLKSSMESQEILKSVLSDMKKKRPEYWKSIYSAEAMANFKPDFYSVKGGLSVFIDKLSESLKAKPNVQFEFEKIQGIKKEPHAHLNSKKRKFGPFDHVLFAMPVGDAATILKSADKPLADKLSDLKKHSVNVIYSAWAKKNIQTAGFAYYMPRKENLSVYGMEFIGNAFPEQSPEKMFIMRMILPGDLSMLSDDDIISLTETDLKKTFSLTDQPAWSKVYRQQNAHAKRDKGYKNWKKDVQELVENHKNITMIGSDFQGPGLANLLEQTKQLIADDF
ncbi:MAG: protoporphyrinogen oxidase [Leptospirales bacterium]